eukprot:TRINITY_DN7275_c0_g1_i3.p1 TRINITY_DN7275_c0_g1~~TRINITY_DN7275_c0_g1_i3.p1  ORF type:complete len:294 (+),score=44.83 TRINITY_DN7275_c0_g1_i3:302-1183(+)
MELEGQSLRMASVGCISKVQNPIKLAISLLNEEKKGRMLLGRIRPMQVESCPTDAIRFLVGEGAHSWARNHGIDLIAEEELITPNALKAWKTYSSRLDAAQSAITKVAFEEENHQSKKRATSEDEESILNDTVGAICIDSNGNVTAGVSSGGIAMKQQGRIGEAAVPGAGCWIEWRPSSMTSCITSGAGENIMKSCLARTIAEMANCVNIEEIPRTIRDHLNQDAVNQKQPYDVGFLAIKLDSSSDPDVSRELSIVYGHNTPSFGVGWFHHGISEPECHISTTTSELKPSLIC